MKKIFISQPMNGVSDEEIIRRREAAIKTLKKFFGEDMKVVNPFKADKTADGSVQNRLKNLGKSIQDLGKADAMVLLPGFAAANGCMVELVTAVNYGIPYYVYEKNGTITPSLERVEKEIFE